MGAYPFLIPDDPYELGREILGVRGFEADELDVIKFPDYFLKQHGESYSLVRIGIDILAEQGYLPDTQ